MRSPRRRHLLELAAGAATTAAAGCLSTGDAPTDSTETTTPTGDASTTGTTTESDSASATIDGDLAFHAWFPAPSALDVDPYWTFYGDFDALRDADASSTGRERVYQYFLRAPRDVLQPAEIERFATAGRRAGVCSFSADPAVVRDRIESIATTNGGYPSPTATAGAGTEASASSGRETATASDDALTATASGGGDESGTTTQSATATESDDETSASDARVDAPDGYVGYALGTGVVWLGADHVVFGHTPEVVASLHAARNGDEERYSENADYDAVASTDGTVDLGAASAHAHQFVESATAFSYEWTFDDPVSLRAAFAFEDASATANDRVLELSGQAGFAEYDDLETNADGRVVSLTGTISPSEFDLLQRDDGGENGDDGNGSRSNGPQISFAFEFRQGKDGEWDGDEAERVVVTHDGGDSVAVDQITIFYDGTPVSETARVDQTKPGADQWQAGGEWKLLDATTNATFESGAPVRVVWESERNDSALVLAKAVLP